MTLSEIIFARDTMWDMMNFLASSEKVMFAQNSVAPKIGENSLQKFAEETLKRCEELQENIGFLDETADKFNVEDFKVGKGVSENMRTLDQYREQEGLEGTQLFEDVEKELRERHANLYKQVDNRRQLVKRMLEGLERLEAVRLSAQLIPVDFGQRESSFVEGEEKKLQAFYGLLPNEHLHSFQRTLFRLTRGNIFFKYLNMDILEKVRDQEEIGKEEIKLKSLIFILCPVAEENLLHDKIRRMLASNSFEELPIPYSHRRQEIILGLEQDVNDNREILHKTNSEINGILDAQIESYKVPNLSFVTVARLIIARELNFARQLIYIEKRDNLYALMVWIPSKYFKALQQQLDALREDDEGFVKPKLIKYPNTHIKKLKVKKVPTFFDLGQFTFPFQKFVDTYGVPNYKEVNPALFTIISFPFFFGLMYGDVGHGSLVLLCGILLLIFAKDPNSMLSQVKWLIFLMGFFAVYCGIIYSEFFATPLPLFNSCYDVSDPNYARKTPNCVYPVGLDYVWYLSENETSFLNSFKMKFSIIIGVIHMLFGTTLKASNAIYFGKWEDLVFEAIPQFFFMLVTFGYMSFCIVYKWLINWEGKDPISIIQLFINFTNVEVPLYGPPGLQETLQTSFVIICFVCFLLMILPKPLVLYYRNKKTAKKGIRLDNVDDSDDDHESKHTLISKFLQI